MSVSSNPGPSWKTEQGCFCFFSPGRRLFNWLFFEEKSWGNNGGVLKWGEGGLFMLDTGPPANAGDAVQSLK